MNRRLLLVASLAAFAACTPAAPAHDMAADTAAIGKIRDAYGAAFNAGNADGVAALFAADANMMDSMQPSASGSAAIGAALKGMMDQMSSTKVTITSAKLDISGDMAYDMGTYKTEMTPKTGAAMTEEGRYLVVLKRQADGGWKLAASMGNLPAMPAAAMPAAPKKK